MEKPKIYLETTLFNYYFDKDRDAHADTVKLFMEIAEGKYEAFTSSAVVDELENAPNPKKDMMLALIDQYPITPLRVNDAANELADIYVAKKIVPARYRTDGVHIAVATAYGLDYIVSMNFQHIVKPKVKRLANAVNFAKGYRPIEIINPMEPIEDENTQHD